MATVKEKFDRERVCEVNNLMWAGLHTCSMSKDGMSKDERKCHENVAYARNTESGCKYLWNVHRPCRGRIRPNVRKYSRFSLSSCLDVKESITAYMK